MQNNFERAVQQKMEELTLTPSAPVWQKVEREIAAKKRRRRGIFWLLFAALLLAGGWWFSPFGKNTEKPKDQTTLSSQALPKKRETDTFSVNKGSHETTQRENASQTKTGVSNELTLRQSNGTSTVASLLALKKSNSVSLKQNNASLTSLSNEEVKKNKVSKRYKSKERHEPEHQQSKTETAGLNTRAVTKILEQKNTSASQKNSTPNVSNHAPQHAGDSSTLITETTPGQAVHENSISKIDTSISEQETKKKVSPAKIDTALKRKVAAVRKWRNSLALNTGWSSYAENGYQSPFSASALSLPPQNINAPGVASAARTGLHFSVGFSRTKKIGKRWEIAAGIQYTYASVYGKVGDKRSSNIAVRFMADSIATNGFYTNTGTTDYTNHFHFIEVPVSVSFKPSLRLPLYLVAGAAYGCLLSTNALTFSAASNIYYQNNQNYLRNALPIFSAVQVGLFERKKVSLRTGPFLQYNLLKLRKENTDGVPHLVFAGLKTAVNF